MKVTSTLFEYFTYMTLKDRSFLVVNQSLFEVCVQRLLRLSLYRSVNSNVILWMIITVLYKNEVIPL